MWSTFKALPLLPKIVIVCLVLGFIYKVSAISGNRNPDSFHSIPVSVPIRSAPARNTGQDSSDDDQPRQNNGELAQLQAQQSQLMAQVQQCEGQMTQATNQQAMAAMNGQMYNQRPPCEAYMPQWISQEAFLETRIARTEDPNDHRSLHEITGIAPPPSGVSSGDRYGSNDGGLEVVENYDREAIRGNSRYTDESGQQHELPTQNHYYRDRSSGTIVGTDQPTPPSDGRDYEQFSNAGQPE